MSLSRNDTHKLAHLLRRAGFGARPQEWTAYAALGVAGTTERLLHPESVPDHLAEVMQDINGDYIDVNNLDSLRQWWLYRMAHSQRPLEEKMTLFWHNHFATANYKVDRPERMWQQNKTLRAHALGSFRTLLQAISRDPAMMVWLDAEQNKKGKPNENFGRELQELFTLGIGSGYTETDVKEVARAFTGWSADNNQGTFWFDPNHHDDGPKTFLGETGNFNGDDIIDIIVRQPATARFICTKLFKFFVHDTPTPADLKPLIDAYFRSGYEIRDVLQAALTSPAFYSEQAFYAKIKSPVEFLVTTVRTLNAPMAALDNPSRILRNMGQDLFNPPNVKGWPEGRTWMNTTTMLTRLNFVNYVTHEMSRRGSLTTNLRAALAAQGLGEEGTLATPEQMVDAVWNTLLPGLSPTAATRRLLAAFVQEGAKPGQAHFDSKAAGLTFLILSAPEYHLA